MLQYLDLSAPRIFCAAVGLHLLVIGSASAQQSTPLKVRGDTTHAPRGCSATAGISAIRGWFAAFSDADSARLAKASSTPHGRFVFSIGKFATSDTFIPARTFEELLAYARKRARHHERITVEEIRFDGWDGRVLQWDSLYFTRSADDLGDKPLRGVGKGGYWCRQGVWYLHLAPRPDIDAERRR
ncbi:MAG TPA: hypothetical protein VM166_14815 [Gemmatimonadaceae bacterium]|nr:hypothetical protein [Gemmatimonadaceae bacterium]